MSPIVNEQGAVSLPGWSARRRAAACSLSAGLQWPRVPRDDGHVSLPACRARRRLAWCRLPTSPAVAELLGCSPWQLTRAQRVAVIAVVEQSNLGLQDPWLRARIRAAAMGVDDPSRRLLRGIKLNNDSVRDAPGTAKEG
jgi:hypothetical protein